MQGLKDPLLFLTAILPSLLLAQPTSFTTAENTVTFRDASGEQVRLEFYSDAVIRVRRTHPDSAFLPDDHYPMVATHTKTGQHFIGESETQWNVYLGGERGQQFTLTVSKDDLGIVWTDILMDETILEETVGAPPSKGLRRATFSYDPAEHFCGLGHQAYGLVESLDLRGKAVNSNYGTGQVSDWGAQGVLTVPFYMSNKGYGIFLNSSYPHNFNFGKHGKYFFEIDNSGERAEMDYFFISGQSFREILDHYTALTGRPRLPQRSMFGLQLSDKGYPENSGADWWRQKILDHRDAGFPLDHMVNDNRWRAGSGAWSGSSFAWSPERYPDPAAWKHWCDSMGLTLTLDLNRNISNDCSGWKEEYNIPHAEMYVKEGDAAPDYTDPAVRDWLWQLFWEQSFNPALGYPGDGIWIDETDELFTLPDTIVLANGRSWLENENLYQFYMAQAAVSEGWDNLNNDTPPGIRVDKRPYVWSRGQTAGGQRMAVYWTGDLKCSYQWMVNNVRAMQAAGLSGFPFFNHDAGGFRGGPDDGMYIQWAMAMGSFSPIWRPHGYGDNKRWPLDRSDECQQAARRYAQLRYSMMPYLYSYAHMANRTGLPIVRPMLLDNWKNALAWEMDLQYYWGDHLIVVPSFSSVDTTLEVWLPPGPGWYDYWSGEESKGDKLIDVTATPGFIPLFVRKGAIIPKHPYVQSTAFMQDSLLVIDIYTGGNGNFLLFEDDGVSERFSTKGELRTTLFEYHENKQEILIHPSDGTYRGASAERKYLFNVRGLENARPVLINDLYLPVTAGEEHLPGMFWNKETRILEIRTDSHFVNRILKITLQ